MSGFRIIRLLENLLYRFLNLGRRCQSGPMFGDPVQRRLGCAQRAQKFLLKRFENDLVCDVAASVHDQQRTCDNIRSQTIRGLPVGLELTCLRPFAVLLCEPLGEDIEHSVQKGAHDRHIVFNQPVKRVVGHKKLVQSRQTGRVFEPRVGKLMLQHCFD